MAKRTVAKLPMTDKRVLIRVDFNVPLAPDGRVSDDMRIRSALPTIREALKSGAKVILMSHLGRPRGKPRAEMSLKPVAEALAGLLNQPVTMAPDCVGPEVEEIVSRAKPGDVLLLENLRFHSGEESNDIDFARGLRALCDLYVVDAFGTAHRKHASMYGVPSLMPAGTKAVGFLIEKEIRYLGVALEKPRRPFVAILGGAKVSGKVGVIENLVRKVDRLLIGGAMSYTLMVARGQGVGDSKVEREVQKKDGTKVDVIALARGLLRTVEESDAEMLLPEDHLVGRQFSADTETAVQGPEIDAGWLGLDIGPATIELYKSRLRDAGTVVWNGPMGVFEMAPFAAGTRALAETLADADATTIIGGGDTAAAIRQFGLADRMSHISTGGGASLRFLEGKPFACLEVIDDA